MSDVIPQIAEKLLLAACMLLLCKRGLQWKMKSAKKWILAALVMALRIGSAFLPEPYDVLGFLLMPFPFLILSEGKIIDSWLNILIIQFGLTLFDLVFVSFKVLFVGLEEASAMFYAVTHLVMLLLCVFLTSRRAFQIGAAEYRQISRGKRIFILALLLAAEAMSAIGSIIRDSVGGHSATAFFCIIMTLVLIGIACILVWLLVVSHTGLQYKEQSRLKEEIIESQKMYYQAMLEKSRELRAFRHDMGNQLGVLSILYEKGDQAEFKKQLDRLLEDFNNTKTHHVSVGDEVIDAVLNAELEKAARLGIRFRVDGRVDGEKHDLYDLCAIFSNSVRNAVEACAKHAADSEINMVIKMHNDTTYYRIENTATEEDFKNLMEEKTSKDNKELHGFGAANIKRAVERMKGRMQYSFQEGKVILEIFA